MGLDVVPVSTEHTKIPGFKVQGLNTPCACSLNQIFGCAAYFYIHSLLDINPSASLLNLLQMTDLNEE